MPASHPQTKADQAKTSNANLKLRTKAVMPELGGVSLDMRALLGNSLTARPEAPGPRVSRTLLAADTDARNALARKAADAGSVTSTAALADAILEALASPRTAA